jgi:hypothetical protein
MRDESGAEDLIDSRDAASFPQLRIDNDQVQPTSKGRSNGAGFCRLNATNAMAHFHERVHEKHGDQGIVFHDEYLQGFHWFASSPATPSIRLCNSDAAGVFADEAALPALSTNVRIGRGVLTW